MLLFGVFSLAVSPGTWPGGAWVPGRPCPGFSLLLFSHDPEVAFSIMHQDVSHVSLAQRASPQFENRVQIFTSHLSMMNLQDQVTLTNWPASKKKKALTQNPWKGYKFHVTEVLLCRDHFAWQLQDFVCLGSTFAWQAQYF